VAVSDLLSFAVAAFVMVALPGPDQALITRNALVAGPAAARRTLLGGACGLSIHATAAAVGLSALLATSATAYTTLKLAGIAYLLFLALRMLASPAPAGDPSPDQRRTGPRHPFAQGLLSNALNPKVALFFLTFLPQFLPSHGATLPAALVLSGLFALIYVAWFSLVIRLVERLGRALRKPWVQRRLERVTASALLAFAIRLGTSAKP
jgi:threonine/homoserine/homoserine lactone efflux protein